MNRPPVAVTGAFDDLRARGIRFLEEAAKRGPLSVLLWDDASVRQTTGAPPKFDQAERRYFLSALRWVSAVKLVSLAAGADELPAADDFKPAVWAVEAAQATAARRAWCARQGVELLVLTNEDCAGFPPPAPLQPSGRKKVVVTGTFDWFHSGHARFFEEASAYGDLYVVVGHDANIRLLKGEGHPLLPQAERRYTVGSMRCVTQALISTGEGWLDADPEIQMLKPDIYLVNEDGDRGGKREYCQARGLEYIVLKRAPAPGLPQRSSTRLRGF